MDLQNILVTNIFSPETESKESMYEVSSVSEIMDPPPVKVSLLVEEKQKNYSKLLENGACYGILKIKDLQVPIYEGDPFNAEELQKLTDQEESCVLFQVFVGTKVIADHNNQGFDILKTLHIGDKIIIQEKDQTLSYVVKKVDLNGSNDGTIFYSNGDNAYYDWEMEESLNLYTCNEDWKHITIVHCVLSNS